MLKFSSPMVDSFEVRVSNPKKSFQYFFVVLSFGNFRSEDDLFVFSEY